MTGHIERRGGERRHLSMTEVVSIVMLMLQLAALVWGAATLNASVGQVQSSLREMRDDVRETSRRVERLTIDVGVLQADNDKIKNRKVP